MRKAAVRPGTGGAQVQAPGSDPGVDGAMVLDARVVDPKHLLATGRPPSSRDLPASLIPPLLYAPPELGKKPCPGSPPHPARDSALG